MLITKKYRPEPCIEPMASRLTYERSTTELSRSIQFCYLINLYSTKHPNNLNIQIKIIECPEIALIRQITIFIKKFQPVVEIIVCTSRLGISQL